MYNSAHFTEERVEAMHGLIGRHPLGALVVHGPDGLRAEHVPFMVAAHAKGAGFGTLRSHVARANTIWQCAAAEAMVIFQGPSGYVSPSLYDEKAVSGKVVPTYNYAVVHAYGRLRAFDGRDELLQLVSELTRAHEKGMAQPWTVSDAPADYIDKLLGAIVGIEIDVERMEGKWKASQNRPAADRERIAQAMPALMGVRP